MSLRLVNRIVICLWIAYTIYSVTLITLFVTSLSSSESFYQTGLDVFLLIITSPRILMTYMALFGIEYLFYLSQFSFDVGELLKKLGCFFLALSIFYCLLCIL